MPDKPVEADEREAVRTEAAVGGRRITLDPIREYVLKVPAREVESTIPCGFQQVWGQGTTPDGEEFVLASGAGCGSGWGTFDYRGRRFAFRAVDLVAALVEAIDVRERRKCTDCGKRRLTTPTDRGPLCNDCLARTAGGKEK